MTQFEQLNTIKVRKQISSYIYDLRTKGYTFTGYYTGSGRHTKARSYRSEVEMVLEPLGISYATGNNAPRGGVSGEYIVITSKTLMADIRKATGSATDKEYYTLLRNASTTWTKPKKHTKTHLIQAIEEKLNGDKFKYGFGVCRMIVKGEQIVGVLEGGFHLSVPKLEGYDKISTDEWITAIKEYATAKWGDVDFIKADYSHGAYIMRQADKKVEGAIRCHYCEEIDYDAPHEWRSEEQSSLISYAEFEQAIDSGKAQLLTDDVIDSLVGKRIIFGADYRTSTHYKGLYRIPAEDDKARDIPFCYDGVVDGLEENYNGGNYYTYVCIPEYGRNYISRFIGKDDKGYYTFQDECHFGDAYYLIIG